VKEPILGAAPIRKKLAWAEPVIKVIDLNSAKHGSSGHLDGGGRS